MIRLRAGAALTALGLLALLSGCTNPFTPAVPEQPTGTAIVEKFGTPLDLLSTLSQAVSVRGPAGRTAYMDALADSTDPGRLAFYAFHAPAAVEAWRADTHRELETWDRSKELLFFDYLSGFADNYAYDLEFVDDNSSGFPPTPPEGFATLRKHYSLTASTEADGRMIVVGNADLYFQKIGARWYLYRWEDRIDPAYGPRPADTDNLSMGARRLESTSNLVLP